MSRKKKKSITEMTPRQIKRHSLSHKVAKTTLGLTLILGIISLIAGSVLYMIPAVNNYLNEIIGIVRTVGEYIEEEDSTKVCKDVMDIYNGMSEDEQNQVGTESYYHKFDGISETEEYKGLVEAVEMYEGDDRLQNIFIAGYDKQKRRLIYIYDPEWGTSPGKQVGEWEKQWFRSVWADLGKFAPIASLKVTDDNRILFTGALPLINDEDEVVGYVFGSLGASNLYASIAKYLLIYVVILIIVILLITAFMSMRIRKILVKPLERITEAAQAYSDDKQKGSEATDHFEKLDLRTGDEIERLSLVMTNMEKSLNTYEEDLKKVTAEKERISTELALASRIQEDMLPSTFPAFPNRGEFDVYASMSPAKEVGGDFYDFFLVDEDHLALVIADVSGKGIPAALFMMSAKIILDNMTTPGKTPAEVLRMTNNIICANNQEEMFVTVWLGILEISSGRLVAANAGHEKPVLIHADGSVELVKEKHGFVIGGMEGMMYKDYEMQLQSGDKIFLYTDGVPEATSTEKGLFGVERMLEAIQQAPDAEPEEILRMVRAAVDEFVGEDEQFDDLTMLCAKLNSKNH